MQFSPVLATCPANIILHDAATLYYVPTKTTYFRQHLVLKHQRSTFSLNVADKCLQLAIQGKGRVHPITGHEGPEVEKRYSSILSLTSALDGVGWLTPRPGRYTTG